MSNNEYSSFEKLEKNEVGNYTIECNDKGANITIIAPHGGRIEPRTDAIAKAIAGYNLNYYGFISERGKIEGRKNMHMTSHKFDEPKVLGLVEKSKVVIAIHGCKDVQGINKTDYGKHIFIGGLDEELKNVLKQALSRAGLSIGTEKFPAIHPENICNRGSTKKGVQFELTKSFRDDAECYGKFIKIVRGFLLKNHS